jgi:DNA-binding beta-propeller fold protein YncE
MGRSSISVRGLAAIAAVCALFCVAVGSASAAPLLWTSNFGEDTVSTVDSATGREVGSPITVPAEPESIAITPNGRRAVVLGDGEGTVTVIDTATRTPMKTFDLESSVRTVAISPDGQSAYVTSPSGEEITVIDPETAKLIGSFPVGSPVGTVAFSPDGTSVLVGTGTEDLAVVDTASEEVVGEPIPIGGFVTSIVFAPEGATAYVTSNAIDEVKVVDVALGEIVKSIPMPPGSAGPRSLAMSPGGRDIYVGSTEPPAIHEIELAQGRGVGEPIALPIVPNEIALTPDGANALAAGGEVVRVNLAAERAEPPFGAAGNDVFGFAITPDQSPTAAYTVPSNVTPGTPATFSGAASTDPDGSIVSWNWAFGDGGTATGVSATHTYAAAGTYEAKLSVVDEEGCGEEVVFTGRTAYCSGSAPAVHAVTAKAAVTPMTPIAAPLPSNKFRFGRIVHDLRNGTVRAQVKLPSAGFVLLFGPKVHAVTRKSRGVQTMWLTLHARVRLAKRLKKTLRAPVKFRVTFTPNGGTAKTVHGSVTLQRAPRHTHRH